MRIIWDLLATLIFALSFGMLFLRWLAQGGGALPYPFSAP